MKETLRTCIVCRKQGDKRDFVRVVKTSSGEIILDETGKAAGRGAYICANQMCLEKAIKTHALNRAFKMQVDESVLKLAKEKYERKD